MAAETEDLPDDLPADARLRDQLELAADVLDATAETPGEQSSRT